MICNCDRRWAGICGFPVCVWGGGEEGEESGQLLLKVLVVFFSKQPKMAKKMLIHVYFFEFKVNF